jgi:hypothetical protein
MNNFPRKDLDASVHLLKYDDFYSAYLKLNGMIFNMSHEEAIDRVGYIPGEAKRVEFGELPELVQTEFLEILNGFGLDEKAHGLQKLPEFVEVQSINGFTIFKKRQKMRINNFKVEHEEKEVWKGNSIEGANSFIEDYLSGN